MKNFSSRIPLLSLGVLLSLGPRVKGAEVTAPVPTPAPAAPSTELSASTSVKGSTKLPHAAAEVVKLTKAQVSEEVVISYVQNSSSTTRLTPDDIVRLRNEGVSDRVIYAMMDKNNKAIAVASASANTTPQAPVYQDVAPPEAQAPAPQQPATAPLTPSASSTYVIPYPAATTAYYGSYAPYYYPYPPYYGYYGGPVFSFRFGYGGGYHHGHGGHYYGGHGGIHAHGHRHR
jgi:hypothetical protein